MIYRAYYNKHSDAPQVWSIDEGTQDSEIHVLGFVTEGKVQSRWNGERSQPDCPVAWIEIKADGFRVLNGIAIFERK